MKAKISLRVTVAVDGDYYTDAEDLASHVGYWISGALDDRDDIDAYGDGLSITRINEPTGDPGRPRTLHPAERKYMLDAARGYTAQQTAKRHLVATSTVNTALKRAKAALNATNIAHAVSLALASGEFTVADVTEEA